MVEETTQSRIAREMRDREISLRKQEWRPPQLLPSPNPIPGWAFKYIRISLMGSPDPTNASAMLREGWEPVKAADHPEIMHTPDEKSRYKDNIEIGGLLLCKAPQEMVEQRRKYYADQTEAQIKAVDNNFMRQNDARMPLFAEKRSTSSFGRGSK